MYILSKYMLEPNYVNFIPIPNDNIMTPIYFVGRTVEKVIDMKEMGK